MRSAQPSPRPLVALRRLGRDEVLPGFVYASSEKYGPGRLWVLIVYGR